MARGKRIASVVARRYLIGGRVQGVGFRYFAQRIARQFGLTGYARNLPDGRVEVYAIGPPQRLSAFSGYIWNGPPMSDVRSVNESEAEVRDYSEFHIEHFE